MLDQESVGEVTLSPYHSPERRVSVEMPARKVNNSSFSSSGKSSSYSRVRSDSSLHDAYELTSDIENGKGNVIDLRHESRFLWIHRLNTATSRRPRLFGAAVIVVFVIPCIIIIIVLSQNTSLPTRNSSEFEQFSVTTQANNGLIATDTAQCSQIGADIMTKGGNAVDAAIAASFCLGVISPASSGIGGGCFILIYNQTSRYSEFIDSREVAPQAASQDMFNTNPLLAQNGGLAIAVPGEVRGMYLAYQRHGSGLISWSDLIEPAAKLAEHWIISPYVGNLIQSSLKPFIESGQFPELYVLYSNAKTGQIKQTGDTIQQPILAHTLRMIGMHGPDYLYVTMANTLAAEIQAAGGIITSADIISYHATIRPALKANISGYQYIGVGGSSSGGAVVAGLLKFMFSYAEPLNTLGNIYYHRLLEGMKHVFAIRLSLGDPSYVNTTAPLDALLSDEYMGYLATKVTSDHRTQPLDKYGGHFNISYASKTDHGTSHISVLDANGLAVAMTTTVNTYFGSKVISPSTGMLFNNEMDDFSIPNALNYFGLAPSPLNFVVAGKKPLSSMSPSILLDKYGHVRLVGGASGGPRIITATAQTILNYIGKGLDIISAVTSPRVHSQLVGTQDLESQPLIIGGSITMPQSIWKLLKNTGQQNLTACSGSMGVAQFIAVDPDTGVRTAVSDPRKNGRPAVQKQ